MKIAREGKGTGVYGSSVSVQSFPCACGTVMQTNVRNGLRYRLVETSTLFMHRKIDTNHLMATASFKEFNKIKFSLKTQFCKHRLLCTN